MFAFHVMFVTKEVQDKLRQGICFFYQTIMWALKTSQEIVALRPCAFGWMTC